MQTITASPPKTKANLPRLIAGSLFGLALVIRFVYALQLPFPPLDDPAYYVQGARSFFLGRPLDLSIIWNYHPTPAAVLHPGFDFWMPMTSFLVAGSFLVLGDTPIAAQLPSVVAGSILVALSFWLARKTFARLGLDERKQLGLAGGAGLFIALNPLLAYQSAVPDSQMIFAAFATAAILIWTDQKSFIQNFCLGLLFGLAYLSRSHAVFLVMAWFFVTLYQFIRQTESRREILARTTFTSAGLGLAVIPWLLRNWLVFGTFSSPAAIESAFIADYATLFNYETPVNFNSFLNLGFDKIVQTRLISLYNAWVEVFGTMFVPTVVLPGLGLFLLWRRGVQYTGRWLLYCLLSGLGLPLIFAVASTNGSIYHSSGSMAAFGAIGYIYLLYLAEEYYRKVRRTRINLFAILLITLLVVELIQFGLSAGSTISGHRRDQAVYERLNAWLKANNVSGPVIADEPSTLNYATGLPALRLPSDEPLEVVQRLAKRYQAQYIVVTGNFGRYPALLQAKNNTIFPQAYIDPQSEFEIYRVVSSQ